MSNSDDVTQVILRSQKGKTNHSEPMNENLYCQIANLIGASSKKKRVRAAHGSDARRLLTSILYLTSL